MRFNIRDRATGERIVVDAPVRREAVLKGKGRVLLPPNKSEVDDLKAVLKARSVLGLRGGCLG